MVFEPLYLKERIHQTTPSNPEYQKNKLNLINPMGSSGIVTLWSEPGIIWKNLRNKFPKLFNEDSPLVALSSLYGNGIPQMLANLANNPQIQYLAVTGNDLPAVRSFQYLQDFLNGQISPQRIGGIDMWKVGESSFYIDAQLIPEMFKHLKVQRFRPSELERMVEFISLPAATGKDLPDRRRISLAEPKFKDYPSEEIDHNVIANTPLDAWKEVIYLLDRFGVNVQIDKGIRRRLINLDVSIRNPSFESEKDLRSWGFEPEDLRNYQKLILDPNLPEDTTYTYGHRLRTHWGDDALKRIGQMLRKDAEERHCLVSLWDTRKDLMMGESSPCFTDAYFFKKGDKLDMTASFRTHNATSAYLPNIYGLRAIQEMVANEAKMNPGQINLRSRWISLDPENAKTASIIASIKERRKVPIEVHDPRGYFVIEPQGREIIAEHHAPNGILLDRYKGTTALDIKDQMRQNKTVIDPDHAIWIGYELAKAHYKIHGTLPEM